MSTFRTVSKDSKDSKPAVNFHGGDQVSVLLKAERDRTTIKNEVAMERFGQ